MLAAIFILVFFLNLAPKQALVSHLSDGQGEEGGCQILFVDDVPVGGPRLCDELVLLGPTQAPEIEVALKGSKRFWTGGCNSRHLNKN